MQRFLQDHRDTIRKPVHKVDERNKLKGVYNQLAQELGRPPTPEEMATYLGWSKKKVEGILRAFAPMMSLDAVFDAADSKSGSLKDVIPDYSTINPVKAAELNDLEADLQDAIDQLSSFQQNIIRLFYGLEPYKRPYKPKEISQILDCSIESVRRTLTRIGPLLLSHAPDLKSWQDNKPRSPGV